MSFRELEYIMGIEKYHNITKAAEAMFISQPTLRNSYRVTKKNWACACLNEAGIDTI